MDVEGYVNRNLGMEERKETEEEYDARLEREENERLAAEKQRRLEALKDRHQRDIEKPPQNGVRFKGTQNPFLVHGPIHLRLIAPCAQVEAG